MPVAAEIQPLLDALNSAPIDPGQFTPETIRAALDALWATMGGTPLDMTVTERQIPGGDGDITVRIYDPGGETSRPLILSMHGGGFVVGSLDSNDVTCRQLAHRCGAAVVSVDYRLAPEHPWPAGSDDCLAALIWCVANADALGADARRVVISGDSAGANLAAVTAWRAATEVGPPIALQALFYPCFDPLCATESYERNGSGFLLTADQMRWFWDLYLTDEASSSDARVDVRNATDLSALPPAVVITAEYDPLRDEGADYAAQLRDVGVPVQYSDFDGMVHGFASMFAITDRSYAAIDLVADAVRAL